MNNHYFDKNSPLHPYACTAQAHVGTLPPDNAIRVALPFDFIGDGRPIKGNVPDEFKNLWPCESDGQWRLEADHRGEKGYVNGEFQVISEVGPYPAGWSDTRPLEPLTLEETIADYEARIQRRLDDFARTLTYDGILSACTYATSTVEMYRIEGQYCVDARDSTWAAAYTLMSGIVPLVMAGGAVPTWEEIEAQLPPLAWPAGSRGYAAGGE